MQAATSMVPREAATISWLAAVAASLAVAVAVVAVAEAVARRMTREL